MKTISILLFSICTFSLFAQTTYVPDDNFELALIDLGYDDVLDDYVLTANINAISSINLNSDGISDLTGIEGFIALTYLDCQNNNIINLDVSQNTALNILYCANNQLTNLDISQNAVLTQLACHINQLTNLDVSKCTALTHLACGTNSLTYLDVSQNTALTALSCSFNQLNNLDIRNGNNANIINSYFDLVVNPNLTCIFVDDASWSAANWTNIDPASTFVETQAECDALIGIDDVVFDQSFNIYPNPTTDIISIESFDLDVIDKIYLLDILGQRILDNQKSMQIDISDFPSGIYFLNIESKKGNKAVYKVIKE